jgi:hypothetical protein
MKNKFTYIITAIQLFSFASCADFLDTKPLDKMVLEDYWKTQSDVESTVLACYRAMQEDGYMERIILGGELRSDNVVVDRIKLNTPLEIDHINNLTIKPTNSLLNWQDFYRVINYCNAVLEFAPGVTEIDPNYSSGFMRAHQAEAYAIRALSYFYLVRLYKNVPYIDFHYKEDTQQFRIPASSGDSILHVLSEQLKFAETYALASWGRNRTTWQKGRVTKNMIRALQADIYLWMGEYNSCIEACEKIEEDVLAEDEILNYDLATGAELQMISNKQNPLNAFESLFLLENSRESIFELQFDRNQKNNTKLESLYYPASSATGQLSAAPLADYNEKLFFSTTDIRGQSSFDPKGTFGTQGFPKILKYFVAGMITGPDTYYFLNRPITNSNPPNWIIYRLADVYLMKAEALVERNQGGDLDAAFELANLTYTRSNPEGSPLLIENYNSQDNLRKLVFDERQRELLFEGKRWFDMVRFALREDRLAGSPNSHPKILEYAIRKYSYNGDVIRSKLVNTDALFLPIEERELINNPELKQNPYYELYK